MNGIVKWLVFLSGLVIPFELSAQIERWVYKYPYSWYARSIVYGSDNAVYAAGGVTGDYYKSFDLTVVGLTANGAAKWIYDYGDWACWGGANSIVSGFDGNLYVAASGRSSESDTVADFTVISLTPGGTERWVYVHHEPGSDPEWDWGGANSVTYGLDGNIYATGESHGGDTGGDIVVVSITADGKERWCYRCSILENYDNCGYSIVYGSDGNIYLTGESYGILPAFVVISLTSEGIERWVYKHTGHRNSFQRGYSISYGVDGNIYATGVSADSTNPYLFTVICLTSEGRERWIYKHKNLLNSSGWAYSIVFGNDGNIYTAGEISNDFAVVSLNSDGMERWVYSFDPENHGGNAYGIIYGPDGNLYAAGESDRSYISRLTVISLTPDGTERWVYRYSSSPTLAGDAALALAFGSEGNLYVAGEEGGYSGSWWYSEFLVVSLHPAEGVEEKFYEPNLRLFSVSALFKENIKLKFNNRIQTPLKITLYNSLGSSVFTEFLPSCPSRVVLSNEKINNLPAGVYFLTVSAGNITETIKAVKLK